MKTKKKKLEKPDRCVWNRFQSNITDGNFFCRYGMGQSEQLFTGLQFCCPTPPMTPEQCTAGQVTKTQYVNLIHRDCSTAYSYAYDDQAGLHNCPNPTDFNINIC